MAPPLKFQRVGLVEIARANKALPHTDGGAAHSSGAHSSGFNGGPRGSNGVVCPMASGLRLARPHTIVRVAIHEVHQKHGRMLLHDCRRTKGDGGSATARLRRL
eukprot:2075534-Prymnesium_polylepis.1